MIEGRGHNRQRLVIAVLIALTIALLFWTQSRLPALNEKAQMGQRTVVSGLAFDILIPVNAEQPWYQRVPATAVNWGYTNWKGMTFGLLFAAAFFVVLAYLPRHEFKNRLLNTLKGVVTGIPLGVCVNCVTPIAHGMYQAGVRLETVLATLVSSPTLNVIVLSMSFSLLPFHYAVVKIAGVLLFVLVVIPLVSRLGKPTFDTAVQGSIEAQLSDSPYRSGVIGPHITTDAACEIDAGAGKEASSWIGAAQGVCMDFLRAISFVVRATLPLMLLAGVLGAAVIELVPVNDLIDLPNTLLMALLVAVVGVFLPVPIAFDVVIVSLLIASGVPVLFSMTLLFVLGIFSIYPFMILWRTVSPSLSLGLLLGAVLVGLACGYGLQTYETWDRDRIIDAYDPVGKQELPVDQREPAKDLPTPSEEQQGHAVIAIHKQNIALATRLCGQLDLPRDQQFCLADFMFAEFARGSDDRLCQAWEGAENQALRDFCRGDYAQKQLVKRAEAQRDARLCESLPAGPKQLHCLERVAIARITTGDKLGVCRELPLPQLVQGCLQQGIVIRLDKFNDPDSCKLFNNRQQEAHCYANVRILEASKGRRMENCDTLQNNFEKAGCRRVVAFGKIDDGADETICEKLTDTQLQKACVTHALTVRAADNATPELCNSIDGPQAQDICRRVAISRQISQAINQAATLRIGDALSMDTLDKGNQGDSVGIGKEDATQLRPTRFYSATTITIDQIPYQPSNSSGSGFDRKNGVDYGIEDVWQFSFLEFVSPFMIGRGIAAGDFNNDHLPDIVLASSSGVHLFKNLGNGRFARHAMALVGRPLADTYVVALVDVNDDGWLDIFSTSYGGAVSVMLNDGAGFEQVRTIDIPNEHTNLAIAAGFTDLDRDGDLDLMLGNWSFGEDKSFLENYSANRLLENAPAGFVPIAIDEVKGDSLSVLFSDLDGNGTQDLAVGNDREIPDMYFLGDGAGGLRRVRPNDDRIPRTPFNTMSIDSADFDNDLIVDIFSTDMSFAAGPSLDYCDAVPDIGAAQRCRTLLAGKEKIALRDLDWCEQLARKEDRDTCLTAIYRRVVIESKQGERCDKIPESNGAHRLYCHNMARKDVRDTNFSVADNLPQQQSNILLLGNKSGQFSDATQRYGVASSFWTWNAKAADLDNDGWQDIYIGNGFRFGENEWELHSNVFFHNQQGKRFTIAQQEFGLEDFVNTPSYVYIDFDFDGDLDILATGVLSPTRLFINQQSAHKAISFSLRDHKGNRFGIGGKVTIRYQEQGEQRHQIREIKASGGFMSFDPPRAHFGLGDNTQISQLEIDWSTGEKTVIETPLPAGRHYIVTRLM